MDMDVDVEEDKDCVKESENDEHVVKNSVDQSAVCV